MSKQLSLFAATADQRYLLGEDLFLRTHYPMQLRHFQANGEVDLLSEESLLQQILQQEHSGPGNRVWVLYGAPGSGKSELIKWLETRIWQESQQRAQVTVRISRDELDVLKIVKRFLHLLPEDFVDQAVSQRWQTARQKSRTVTKLILLFALENLLDSDDSINALFYRLLNVIQPHVDHLLNTEATVDPDLSSMEIIGRETWQAVLQETVLEIPIEYEQFRHQLTIAFQDHLLEGISLPNTMRQIAEYCVLNGGQRPVLLVDDLVQSLNVFATEILDYLLTLEAGCWDVVIGLTPAAFEDNQRGRELLQRITYLDTIDDRVEKLWLSDEAGLNSYVLNEDNCYDFAIPYLQEYQRRLAGNGKTEAVLFVNHAVLVRIFRNLPSGKGKARYFLRYLRQILEQIEKGKPVLETVMAFAKTEYVVRSDDATLTTLGELYGPLLDTIGDHDQIQLTVDLLQAFGLPVRKTSLDIEPLQKLSMPSTVAKHMVDDEEKMAIRDWLLARPVNRQLVNGVRQGAARWLRDVQGICRLHRSYIPKPYGVLRWQRKYLTTNPPIYLEGIDDTTDAGVVLPRKIGMVAFDLYQYAAAKGRSAKILQEQLGKETVLDVLLFDGVAYQMHIMNQLQRQLGLALDNMVLALYVFRLALDGVPELRLPGFSSEFWGWLSEAHDRYGWEQDTLADKIKIGIDRLFEDFFQLRQNLYDGERIRHILEQYPPDNLLEQLLTIDTSSLDKDFRLASKPLREVLAAVQAIIQRCEYGPGGQEELSEVAQQLVEKLANSKPVLFSQIPLAAWSELKQSRPRLFAGLRVHLDIDLIDSIYTDERK